MTAPAEMPSVLSEACNTSGPREHFITARSVDPRTIQGRASERARGYSRPIRAPARARDRDVERDDSALLNWAASPQAGSSGALPEDLRSEIRHRVASASMDPRRAQEVGKNPGGVRKLLSGRRSRSSRSPLAAPGGRRHRPTAARDRAEKHLAPERTTGCAGFRSTVSAHHAGARSTSGAAQRCVPEAVSWARSRVFFRRDRQRGDVVESAAPRAGGGRRDRKDLERE